MSKREDEKRRQALRAQHVGREFTRYLLEYYGPRGRSTDGAGRLFAAEPMASAEAEWATRELMTRKGSGFLGDSGDREEARDLVLEHRRFHVIDDAPSPGHTPNEDLAWREVYARAYKAATAEGLEDWRAREKASRAAWADYEARTGQVPNDSLRRRIAETLGWTESSTRSMSLASLRDLVRPVDPALAEEIGERIRSGRHIAQPGGAQRSQAELWRQMFGREPPRQRPNANGSEYYVWAIARGSNKPLAEGPWGPYETLDSAKTFARIGATEGAHDRAVSLGFDPESSGFRIVRRYEAGTGDRLL